MRTSSLAAVVMLAVVVAGPAEAAPVAVRFSEGATHGFLLLRGHDGHTLAHGELIQTVRGERVESRLVFRFADGSLHDETATFSQRRVFRLLAYRLTQRGPSFPQVIEVAFDRDSGRYRARVGEDSAEGTLEIPEDALNGMASVLLRNLPSGASAAGHLMAFTPKPRALRSELKPEGEDRFLVGDAAFTATRYLMKLEIGGLTGAIATLIGKDPPDIRYWVATAPPPTFVKFEGAMFLKGPQWRIEMAALRWPGER